MNLRIALIRGINVGRAKRVAMADLRKLLEDLGYRNVRTLLNSGNAVFEVPGTVRGDPASRVEAGLAKTIGVPARVTVLTSEELKAAVSKNPLEDLCDNPSRMSLAVLNDPKDRSRLTPLAKHDWTPEALALGARVAYLWCPGGVLKSRLGAELNRALGDAVTTRNWATLTKLHELAESIRQGR